MSVYCQRKYEECRIRIKSFIDIKLLKEMLAFAGWNGYSLFCYVLSTQGLAILLNIFFGVIVNAAYGIAKQVNGVLGSFSSNMIRAFLPQIFKSGGSGDKDRMIRLSMLSSKLSVFLLALFIVPIFLEMDFIINIWLKEVPEYTVMFCRLVLIICLLQQPASGLMAAITSVGNIRRYQIVTGTFQLFNLPIAYILIKTGLPPYFVLVGSIFLELINTGLVIWFAHKLAGLPMKDYVLNTLIKSLLVVILTASLALTLRTLLNESFVRFVMIGIISTAGLFVLGRQIAFTVQENNKIGELFMSFYYSLKNKFSAFKIG